MVLRDNDEPREAQFSTEIADPRRVKLRTLNEDPNCTQFRTLSFKHEPRVPTPAAEMPDPMRA
jgi:hypothetical protein